MTSLSMILVSIEGEQWGREITQSFSGWWNTWQNGDWTKESGMGAWHGQLAVLKTTIGVVEEPYILHHFTMKKTSTYECYMNIIWNVEVPGRFSVLQVQPKKRWTTHYPLMITISRNFLQMAAHGGLLRSKSLVLLQTQGFFVRFVRVIIGSDEFIGHIKSLVPSCKLT